MSFDFYLASMRLQAPGADPAPNGDHGRSLARIGHIDRCIEGGDACR